MGNRRFGAAALGATLVVVLALASGSAATPGPQLQVVSVGATLVQPGGSTGIQVKPTIQNVGDATQPAYTWVVYVSTDATLDAGDLEYDVRAGSLAPGQIARPTYVAGVPGPGSYCVFVQAPAGPIGTGSVGSACVSSSSPPNLKVTALSAPGVVSTDGETVSATVTTANVGAGPAPATYVGIYLSSDATLDRSSDTLLDTEAVGALGTGQSTQITASLAVPARPIGSYTLIAAADDRGEAAESDETDNLLSASLTIAPANLRSTIVDVPSQIPGTAVSFTLRFAIDNLGPAEARTSAWVVYLSRDDVLDGGDTTVQTGATGELGAGASANGRVEVPLPPGVTAGAWCVMVEADHAGVVTETTESDNVATRCVSVQAVLDLTVSSFSVPAVASVVDRTIAPTLVVANAGNAPTAASHVGIYVSSDATLDTGADPRVADVPLPSLAAFSSTSLAPTLSLPPALGAGRYTLFAVADGDNEVSEVNETNNVASGGFDLVSPNLAVQIRQPAADTPTDGNVALAFAIANTGLVAAPATTYRAYLSSDEQIHPGDPQLGQDAVAALAAGASTAPIPLDVPLPPGTGVGRHCVVVAVDRPGAVPESDETDNVVASCFDAFYADRIPPATSAVVDPAADVTGWNSGPVVVHLTATDDTAVREIRWALDGGSEVVVPGAAADAAVIAEGAHTLSFRAVDTNGNAEAAQSLAVKIDAAAPAVSCEPVTDGWQRQNVVLHCTANDGGGSGLANPADASFTLATSVPVGTADAAAPTASRTLCDVVGHCATAGPFVARVDLAPPDVSCPWADASWHDADVSVPCAASDAGSGLAAPGDAAFVLTVAAPPDTEALLPAPTRTVCDAAGNCTTTPALTVRIDTRAPAVSCGPVDGSWHHAQASIHCTASDGGSDLANSADASFDLTTGVPAGTADASAATDSRTVCDNVGNCSDAGPFAGNKVDLAPPTFACAAPDGQWHATDVSIACTAADVGSGLVGPASFSLTTSIASNAETSNAATGTAQACDLAGNCVTAGPVAGVKVDRKAPTVSIAAPTGAYVYGQAVTAAYTCGDGGSGVAACAGPVADGAPVDTEDLGSHTFAVTATDAVGNTATVSTAYSVAYGACVPDHVPPGPAGGKTIRVWVVPCDADGNDVSTKKTELRAVDVDGSSLPKLPGDRKFHREPFGYRYDLDGSKLAAGTHVLRFTISGDPTLHSVQFTVPKPKPGKRD